MKPFSIFLFILFVSCSPERVLDKPFVDLFDREDVGTGYFDTIGRYIIDQGALHIRGGYNHPLWLKKPLPAELEITLDVRSLSPEGDIKIELFGDGKSFAFNRGAYFATGYVLGQGGWNNTKTFIARRDEHDKALLHTNRFPVTQSQWHRWRIFTFMENNRLVISWWIDDRPALRLVDPAPLYGKNNRHFGFSNWRADVFFDNLHIIPLTAARKAELQGAWNTAMQDPQLLHPGHTPLPAPPPVEELPMAPDPSGGIPE